MKNHGLSLYIETVVLTILALGALVVYNFVSFYSNAVSSMEALGQSCLRTETEQIEAYLNKGMNTLVVTANSVNYMIEQGYSANEIEQFLVNETVYCQHNIDANFTGIYGYILDEYVDGVGWIPDNDYVPTEREWYVSAKNAGGEPVLAEPYLDEMTGDIITSVACLLEDGKSVLSLDIALSEVQTMTENINMNNIGYGFVITYNGLVIAHYNSDEKGKNYFDSDRDLARHIVDNNMEYFSYEIDGEDCTVFTDNILNSWNVAMIVSNDKLFNDVKNIFYRNIFISLAVIVVIMVFYSFVFHTMKKTKEREEKNNNKLEKMNMNIVKALAKTIDAKDRYTSGHSQRVANYSREIAKRMGKSKEEQREIYYAGLLHDVGKIRVSEEVINKPGRLTNEEFDQIKIHPVTGYHILKDIYETKNIAEGAKFHHERYDGNGYPNGLSGKNIPEIARIIGIADAYDAMASNRSYRSALPQEKVRSEIVNGKGVQFDPDIAEIMLQMMNEDKNYEMRQMNATQKNVLVIDDDSMTHKLISHIMHDEVMYKIMGAVNGETAMKILEDTPADVVLLDLNLPRQSGFEIFTQIKEKYDVPVIFMTGDRNIETIQKAYEMGIEDYITKPFQPPVLKEVIHSAVNNGR